MQNLIHSLPIKDIIVGEDRQRQNMGPIDDLRESIVRNGLLQPIIVTKTEAGIELIAGERRLRAFKMMQDVLEIPAVFLEDLPPLDRKIVEWEENFQRQNLTWQEEVGAIAEIHSMIIADKPSWTIEATAKYMNISPSKAAKYLQVSHHLEDERVSASANFSAAYNVVERRVRRHVDNALAAVSADIDKTIFSPSPPQEPTSVPDVDLSNLHVEAPSPPKKETFVENVSFLDWAPQYSGPKFNVIHCDFPYGINFQKSDQGNKDTWDTYDDTPEIYWALCQCLVDNLDRIAYRSAHIMFWFSMKYYTQTVRFFERHGLVVQEFPLIWYKSDNRGIVPDVERQPRRVYETALLMSRGDRKLVQPKSNCYACHTQKSIHQSQKPIPMLRHFLGMICDDLAEVLDPTAGSGSAIIAAQSLKASRVLGLEINPEFCLDANHEINKALILANASQMVEE